MLAAIIESGEMPDKNPTAYFPTPRTVVDQLIQLCDPDWWPTEARILEPSAGGGAIVQVLREMMQARGATWQIDCCEILPINRARLRAQGFSVVADDFLAYAPSEPYDVVVMNPPFSVESDKQAWITHVEHAWSMVGRMGWLASVTPFWRHRRDKRTQGFLRTVCDFGGCTNSASGAFKESGTGVSTEMIYLRKADISWREEEFGGWRNWRCWNAVLMAENDRETNDALEAAATTLTGAERAAKVREIYQGIADGLIKEQCEPMWLDDADHAALLDHILDLYDAAELEAAAPTSEPEPVNLEFELGGLFAEAV